MVLVLIIKGPGESPSVGKSARAIPPESHPESHPKPTRTRSKPCKD